MKALLHLSLLIVFAANARSFTAEEAKQKTQFWLYTKLTPLGQQIFPNETSFNSSPFNPNWPTRFIIHGQGNDRASEVNVDIRRAYLQKGNFNVIVVNWGQLAGSAAAFWEYPIIASSIHYIGALVAEFTRFMNATMNIPFDDMYLIGHGMGAHIAGYTGTYVKPHQFPTIYALDPAGPEFEDAPDDEIVDKGDALYVESIQTSTSMGMYRNVGHASFFVNFGEDQPECNTDVCSHSKAYKVFAESIISNETFLGKQCSNVDDIHNKQCTFPNRSVARMGGEPSTVNQNGLFYIYTNSQYPYFVKLITPEQIANLVSFKMFTKTSPNGQLVSVNNPGSLTSAGFNASVPTRFFICDYKRSNAANTICLRFKDVYINKGNYNIVILNWNNALPMYRTQVFDDDLSQPLADFANFLNSNFNVDFSKMSLIGEGLGANIASYAGSRIGTNQFNTLYAIDTNEAIQLSGFQYIESLEASSGTTGTKVIVHIRYGYLNLLCNAKCMHNLAIDTFIKSVKGPQPLYAVRCGTFQDAIIISNRCTNPGASVQFGGEPPVPKPDGDYYYETN